MHNFQPRGIIKWAPFAALNEYQNTVEQLKLELEQETNYRSPAFYEYIDEIINYNISITLIIYFDSLNIIFDIKLGIVLSFYHW